MLGEEDESNSTTNILLKIISVVVLLGMGMGFGVMPYFIERCRKSTKFLGLANSFSGGLFLGIGLFHILPESSELLKELTEAPISFFCAFLSYALILFVEKVLFNSHEMLHSGHDHSHEDTHEHEDENVEGLLNKKEGETGESRETEEKEQKIILPENEHEYKQGSGITPYILLLALGFHGLFEGMALGIQSKIGGTLFLFLAIAAHKWAASLTLGIAFVKANVTKKRLISLVFVFALIGPVGIIFGLILSSTANEIVEGIFLAMSTGTFIYISCSEVNVEEFANPDNKYFKFIMFMAGGVFTAGLSLMEMIDHEGGEHEG